MLKVGAKAKIKVNGRVWRSQDAPIYVVTQHVEGKQWRLQDMSNGQCVDKSDDNIALLRKSRKIPASSSSVGVDKEDEHDRVGGGRLHHLRGVRGRNMRARHKGMVCQLC